MKLKLYQEVALVRDVLDENLRSGDVAVRIDYVPHPRGGEAGPSWRFSTLRASQSA